MPTITITINTDNAAFHTEDQGVETELPDWSVGDIVETDGGIAVVTPGGMWELTESQARNLATGIGHMIPEKG